ncbi:MAG: Gfo/Idh/MocA family oxidoreductase [Thermomicrobiales bacterium]
MGEGMGMDAGTRADLRVRVGVIGLGEVAQTIHLPILEQLREQYQLVAICDVSPSLLTFIGDRYSIPSDARHADMRDLVVRDDLDVVFVLNSDEYHAECAIAALRAGKHVLIEKPMCLTEREAQAVIAARDASGKQAMVGYMRRFAPAFEQAVDAVAALDRTEIAYVRVRDIIGANRLFIEQSTNVFYPTDIPDDLRADRTARATAVAAEIFGDAADDRAGTWRLLCGLSSHDLSAMRELIGMPARVLSAARTPGTSFLHVVFQYDDPSFLAVLETGSGLALPRFDAHLEVYTTHTTVRVDYDSGYIRHLPTTLTIATTDGISLDERVVRPTYADPYTCELLAFHEVVKTGVVPKTPPEDFLHDLAMFRMIVDALA